MRLRYKIVLVVFTGNSTNKSLVDYALLRVSTFSLDSLFPVLDRSRIVRDEFTKYYNRDGNYFGGSSSKLEADKKRTVASKFFTSLRRSNYGDFKSVITCLDLLERIRGNFSRSNPSVIFGSSLWDEYLKLALCCGISTGKSSLAPAIFSDKTAFLGTGELIDNIAQDDCAFYKEGTQGKISYNRATRNCTLYLGKELGSLVELINNRIRKSIEKQTGQRVSFLNVDYRVCADTFEDIAVGNFELVPVEIHPDTVDFINDGFLFESNGTLPIGTIQRYVDDLVSTIDLDIDEIYCPERWKLNSLYQTEVTSLQGAFSRAGRAIPQGIDSLRDVSGTVFNYSPSLLVTGNAVPSKEVVSFLNNRKKVAATLEDAVSDLPNARTARYFVLQQDDLTSCKYPSLRKLKNFDGNNPRAGYDFACFLRDVLQDNGLIEKPLYVVKPNDHSVKKSRPVTFYDISGMQTLLDYVQRYGTVIVEEVDRCLWSERSLNAGSVSEIKTMSLWR